jgi:hypothetical protein
MLTLFTLAALLQPGAAPPGITGVPPVQAQASFDGKDKLRITYVTCTGSNENSMDLPNAKGRDNIPVKVTSSALAVLTVELSPKHVGAFTVDGRTIPADKLEELLAKERSVLVAAEGKKVDPFHLKLYKDDTIVLVPPTNLLNLGGYGAYPTTYGTPYSAMPVPTPTVTEAERPKVGRPDVKPEPLPDDRPPPRPQPPSR